MEMEFPPRVFILAFPLFHVYRSSEFKLARRRVVITGLGIISPVGNSVAEAWSQESAACLVQRPTAHQKPRSAPSAVCARSSVD